MQKLNRQNSKELLDFLQQDSTAHLFLIGDYEHYGLEDDDCVYYGFYEEGQLYAVIMCYKGMSLHVAATSYDKRIMDAIKHLLEIYPKIQGINLFESSYELLKDDLDKAFEGKIRPTLMSEYRPASVSVNNYPVEILIEEDAFAIYELQSAAFNMAHNSPEKIAQAIRNKDSVIYGIKLAGKLVSTATYTAETSDRAMVVAVCTDKEFAGQGYASAVVFKLSDDLWKLGKAGVLFYDNPSAAHVYERLGYRPHGRYMMIEFK